MNTKSPIFPSGLATLGRELQAEMQWLEQMIEIRIKRHFAEDNAAADTVSLAPPPLDTDSAFAHLVRELALDGDDRVVFALALAPHLAPQVLDPFFLKNPNNDRRFSEFGGVQGVHHLGFLPTGETALFLLGGDDVERRLAAVRCFDADRPLFARAVVRLALPADGEPTWSGALSISPTILRRFFGGDSRGPESEVAFAVTRLTTALTWDDLVLDAPTLEAINEIKAWAQHGRTLLQDWGLARHVRPGFRALFHGPPGTGKTLTATLLGKALERDVVRVDLSRIVSKYIGETEKNLSALFAEAERRGWILFFDEADALFGRRTELKDSHDRYANQEVSYLLQRIVDFPGIAILSTNRKANIDEAFIRRLQAIIHFPPPKAEQRLRLWRNILGPRVKLAADVDLNRLAAEHETTGGQIVNVVRRACLRAVQRPDLIVHRADLGFALEQEIR
jgi:hypothetical protein